MVCIPDIVCQSSLTISSGIGLSRPEATVRVHAVQPLFVAGQYLEHHSERKVVLDLLRRIEDDTGKLLRLLIRA